MAAPDFAGTDRLIHGLEREDRERRKRIVAMMVEEGREDLVADFQQRMRDVDTGVYHARMLWHSISSAQRAALMGMVQSGNSRLKRMDRSPRYQIDGSGVPLARPALVSTLRKLSAHGLIDWDGGAFDPEAEAVLSEQGRFVMAKGRPAEA